MAPRKNTPPPADKSNLPAKRTSRVKSDTPALLVNGPEELQQVRNPMSMQGNSTVYKNAPIEGGETEVILNNVIIRSPIRKEVEIDDFMQALKAAEMRYFPNRTRLYDIFFQAYLDGHLFGVIQKRILSVLNQTIYYSDTKGEEVDEMTPTIKSEVFRNIVRTILETRLWGISGMEFLPGKELSFRMIPRKHIKPKTQLISIEQNNQDDGYDYTKLDNVWVIGDPEDLGILVQCAILVIYKRGALADWANFIEIFGMPIRIVKYDPLDAKTEAKLSEKMEESGNLMAMMIPNTAQFEILDGKTANANGDLQNSFIKFLNDEISITVLGNTETTGNSGTGSQAKSKTHSDQQKEIIKSDIEYLENMLNHPHFIRILQSYGLPVVEGGRFTIKSEVDVNRAAQEVLIHTTLAGAGLDIPVDFLYENYNIPQPADGEKVLKPRAGTAPAGPPPGDNEELTLSDHGTAPAWVKEMMKQLRNDFFA